MPFGTGFNAFSIRDWHLAACKMGLQEAASAFMGVLIASELARLAPLGPPIAQAGVVANLEGGTDPDTGDLIAPRGFDSGHE